MAYVSAIIGNVFAVRWDGPTAADVEQMDAEVAAFKRGVSKMHGLAVVPEDTPPPDDATRKAMGRSMKTLLDHLETMHTVIEGDGFKHTILRSVMTGVTLVGGKRGRVFTYATIPEAIVALVPLTDQTVTQLSQSLGRRKILG